MKNTTPQAVQACHELLRWLIPQVDKFPRVRRFALGDRLESALLEASSLDGACGIRAFDASMSRIPRCYIRATDL